MQHYRVRNEVYHIQSCGYILSFAMSQIYLFVEIKEGNVDFFEIMKQYKIKHEIL